MADLEQLLAPVADDQPCGPDRSDNRLSIDQAFERPVSIDVSGADFVTDADWNVVIEQIVDEFRRTKDLWLAIYLCRAAVYGRQWPVLELGADALAGLLERYWDAVHPNLAEYGITARLIACNSLANRAAFVNPLLRAPLVTHARLGIWSAVDFERLAKGREAEQDFSQFQKALSEGGAAQLQNAHVQLGRIEAALRRTEGLFRDKTAGSDTPDFALTFETLGRMQKAVAQFCSVAADKLAGQPGSAAAEIVEGFGTFSTIQSRADVIRAIDAISAYYRENEPGSPVPVLLERARGWVNLPFMEILADIAPESLNEVRRLLLRRLSE